MRKLLRQTWMQVVLVYTALLLLMWIGLRHTSSSDLATIILWVGAILFSVTYATFSAREKCLLVPNGGWILRRIRNTSQKPTQKGSVIHFRKC